MLFIINKDIPGKAKDCLSNYGELFEFSTTGITYPAISNHPDIFFCQTDDALIYAPNTPPQYIEFLTSKGVKLIKGRSPVGKEYLASALYNAVFTEQYFIHNSKISDEELAANTSNKKHINVKQGYCRCSLLPLKGNSFITSDQGIYKTLLNKSLDILYFEPEDIILPGAKNGFFGGTAGVMDNKVFITGSLTHYAQGVKVQEFLSNRNYQVIELYDGKLYDSGSILIIR